MKSTYSQLSQDERYFISSMLARDVSVPAIAREMCRAASTVYRERFRNLRPTGLYAASVAHSYATARRRRARRGSQFPEACWNRVRELLENELSPEQVSNYLRIRGEYSISFQSIYRWVRMDRRRGGTLFTNLRIMPKQRRKRYGGDDSRGVLRGKRSISTRPARINERREFGHWEADTVMGNDNHQCVLTLVERMTGLARMVKLKNKTASLALRAISNTIAHEPHTFKTITFDNGTEFHSYKKLEERFSLLCYFANPHHPWERGSNENFNGLLRQYIPKGTSLHNIAERRILAIREQLNSRPRKRLGYRSPQEVFNELS
jgi:transposase, IS30 family